MRLANSLVLGASQAVRLIAGISSQPHELVER